ncbi:MAG: hypothetical protein GXY25_16225 [Pirellulaceae bacterium]|jgi:hypothetical protein|nr:hypothetical protein [Thermoguttaceae bacterium]NLZ02068.1 hypothetical protein [Pirellulaceae bacterium]
MATETPTCCPPFDPEPWNDKELVWRDKPFVKDRVRSFLHIPLNFRSVMKRNIGRIEAAEALADEPIVVCDENSLWGADVYIAVSKEVPGASMATLSGTFLAKVFEGPYKDIRRWICEMGKYVESKNKRLKRLLFYYTTCPKCAKKYGKNYVVLLGQV